LPQQTFASDVYSLSLDSFVGLKSRWKVAVGAMIKRCGDLNLASEEKIEKLWIARTARGWRTEEPLDNQIPIERPELLSNAFPIVLESQRAEQVMDALSISAVDIEELAGLAPSTLEKRSGNLTVMKPSSGNVGRLAGPAIWLTSNRTAQNFNEGNAPFTNRTQAKAKAFTPSTDARSTSRVTV